MTLAGQRILELFDPVLPQGMSSSERAERYHDDSVRLLAEKNHGKIIAEVKKLRQWLQKHQVRHLLGLSVLAGRLVPERRAR